MKQRWLRIVVLIVAWAVLGLLVGLGAGRVATIIVVLLATIIVPSQWLLLVFLGVGMFVPWDYIDSFSSSLLGVPALVGALIGLAVSLFRAFGRIEERLVGVWDVLILVAAVTLAQIASRISYLPVGLAVSATGIRQSAMLTTGVLVYFWYRLVAPENPRLPVLTTWVILLVGAAQGAAAAAQRIGVPIETIVPGYRMASASALSFDVGARGVGFAGHSLVLGTMCSIGILAGVMLLQTTGPRLKYVVAACIALCGYGLTVSLARGSWLALSIALLAAALSYWRLPIDAKPGRVVVMCAALVVGAMALGAPALVRARLIGSAYTADSLAVRTYALRNTWEVITERWLTGYGFAASQGAVKATGLLYANTENEYIIMLLASGALGLFALILVAGRAVCFSSSSKAQVSAHFGFPALVLLLVVIGTFNLFSWSYGFVLFMLCIAMIHEQRHALQPADDARLPGLGGEFL